MEHYLDNAATTKVCDEAVAAATEAMTTVYGNPSSTHTKGREAKKLLDKSRSQISNALGCESSELVFTSCGSESDNWALMYGAECKKRAGKHIISSLVEHDAIRKSLDRLENEGYTVTRLAPDSTGKVSVESVVNALQEDTILVSLMMVNNETGAVTDINAIHNALVQNGSNAILHTDAVQAFLKIPFKAKSLGADMISISGHKVHAPKGIGALYIRNGIKLNSFIVGGEQEAGRRAGTEALPQIAAFGAAVEAYKPCDMFKLKQEIINRLPGIKYIESDAPHILSISLPGYRSEVLMNYLEAKEIYVSKSSACKQGKRSHVLEACGLPSDVIDGSLRIGLSRFSTIEDVDIFCEALLEAKNTLAHR